MSSGRRIHFKFPCRVKPRMTQASKWAHKAYFEWCATVAMTAGSFEPEDVMGSFGHTKLRLWVGNPRLSSDLSNHLKAVEDALLNKAYADDNCRHLCDSHVSADWSLEGFAVELTPCDGQCKFDSRGKK